MLLRAARTALRPASLLVHFKHAPEGPLGGAPSSWAPGADPAARASGEPGEALRRVPAGGKASRQLSVCPVAPAATSSQEGKA